LGLFCANAKLFWILLLTPATTTFVPKTIPQLTCALCSEIMNFAEKLKPENGDKKLIFHTLSLNGFYTYLILLRYLQKNSDFEQLYSSITGCIIDSAPAYLTPQLATRGFVGFLLSQVSNQRKYEHPLLTPFLEYIWRQKFRRPEMTAFIDELHHMLENQPRHVSQLYLYSSNDALIPYQEIEHHIRLQQQRGVNVRAYNFVTSPHVAHFKYFPDVYQQLVFDFIRDISVNSVKLKE
jgi:hypothetical protein